MDNSTMAHLEMCAESMRQLAREADADQVSAVRFAAGDAAVSRAASRRDTWYAAAALVDGVIARLAQEASHG